MNRALKTYLIHHPDAYVIKEDDWNCLMDLSQVKLLITNNAFCIVQRATVQSKTGILRDFGVAEAPPGFKAGWSDCIYFFSLSLSAHLARSSGFSL
jgi:hypothetical protein